MKKLSKISALTICKKVWTWLAENPDKDKSDCPELFRRIMQFNCPCCEYQRIQNKEKEAFFICKKNGCLLGGIAWGQSPFACEDTSSPYRKWDNVQTITISGWKTPEILKLRTEYALKIVECCDKAIKELKERK